MSTTLHVVGLADSGALNKDSEKDNLSKIFRFCKVFKNHPKYRVVYYGHNESNTDALEHVGVTSDEVLFSAYGKNLDTSQSSVFDLAHQVFGANVEREIGSRKSSGDFIAVFDRFGCEVANKINADGSLLVVEPAVSTTEAYSYFRCYEAYALKAGAMGKEQVNENDPKWYWRIVPAYYNVTDYACKAKENWGVCIVNNSSPWGVQQALAASSKAGLKLKIYGKLNLQQLGISSWPAHVEYFESADRSLKIDLLSKARCGFAIDLNWDSSSAQVVEMMLSGCVPITSDIGATTEYVLDDLNGFRCNTLRDMLRGIKNIENIHTGKMIAFARDNFSMPVAAHRYNRVFSDFSNVIEKSGWFEEKLDFASCSLGLNYQALYT
jgi:glycosyltransferase involved in cell wall biosynthesis